MYFSQEEVDAAVDCQSTKVKCQRAAELLRSLGNYKGSLPVSTKILITKTIMIQRITSRFLTYPKLDMTSVKLKEIGSLIFGGYLEVERRWRRDKFS